MVSLFVATLTLRTQDARVSYTHRAARAAIVIPEFGKAAGIELDVTPEIGNEVLLVSVKDAAPSEVLDRIAIVTSGKWEKRGSATVLTPDTPKRAEEERAELDRYTNEIKALVSRRLADEELHLERIGQLPKRHKGEALNPNQITDDEIYWGYNGLINRLLERIDPSILAQVKTDEKMVFSTSPNAYQFPIAPSAIPKVEAFARKHDADVAKRPKEYVNRPGEFEDQSWQRRGKIGKVAKADLIATRAFEPDMERSIVLLELRLYDENRRVLYDMDDTLTGEPSDSPLSATKPVYSAVSTPDRPGDTAIEYSEDSKGLFSGMKKLGKYGYQIPMGERLKGMLSRLDENNPLSFTASDELLQVARTRHRDLVANVPDTWSIDSRSTALNMKNSDVQRTIDKGNLVKTVPDARYLILKPARPAFARKYRSETIPLAAFVQSAQSKSLPSLDDWATFARSVPAPAVASPTELLLDLFIPCTEDELQSIEGNWSALRLYASLSPAQQAEFKHGTTIPIGSLSADQKQYVRDLVYRKLNRVTYGPNPFLANDYWPTPPTPDWAPDARCEPTELFPNGLPSDAKIVVRARQVPVACPVPVPGVLDIGFRSLMDANSLASRQVARDVQAKYPDQGAHLASLGPIEIGRRTILDVTIELGSHIVAGFRLCDDFMPPNPPVTTEDKLPSDLKQMVKKLAKVPN